MPILHPMHKRTRIRYWSHGFISKWTAKKLGAPPRPKFGTMEEWDAFDKNQKTNFMIQEVVETFLDAMQDTWMLPGDIIHTIRVYLRNRFVDKLHVLQTGLKKGQYYQYDERLLHAMFNSFVQFIEEEQTLENLNWETTLVHDYEWMSDKEEAKQQPDYGKPTPQALSAIEKLALYTWWKTIRPARVDGYIASGFQAFADSHERGDSIFSLWINKSDEENEQRRALTDKWHEIDNAFIQEDEDMMIRLIKVRRSIWT